MTIVQKVNNFFREVYVELRKVSWLTKGEVFRYTVIVLLATIIVAALLGGLDYLFSEALRKYILK